MTLGVDFKALDGRFTQETGPASIKCDEALTPQRGRCEGCQLRFGGTIFYAAPPKMPNPTVIAGLGRIATSLWLHFVALARRMPAYQHRRLGGVVVIYVYKARLSQGLLLKQMEPRSAPFVR